MQVQLSQGGGTHLCRKTSQGNVPGISFEPIPNIPIFELVFGLFNWEKEEGLVPQGEMAENKDQFLYGVFCPSWNKQNGAWMQKCGQNTLKMGYLINFSCMRLHKPSLTQDMHRHKARAEGSSALLANPAGAGAGVANVLIFVLLQS